MIKASIKYLLPVLSGIAIGTSYIPFPPWAVLFCFAPLWIFILEKASSLKESLFAGWLSQLILTLIGFHWIAHTTHEFGLMPWPLAVLILLLYAVLMHVHIPLSCALVFFLKKKRPASSLIILLSLALTQSLFDLIWPSIFPWHLGYTFLYARIPLFHLADIFGFWGLDVFILLINAWIAFLWHQSLPLKKIVIHAMLIGVVFSGFNLWGLEHKKQWVHTDQNIHLAVTQPNIGNFEKAYAEKGQGFQTDIIRDLLQSSHLAAVAHPDIDVFVWPETAVPIYLDKEYQNSAHFKQLEDGLQAFKKKLITGAFSKQKNKTYNGIFLLDEMGKNIGDPYLKNKLLVFGEYIPLSETFPILLKWLPFASTFGKGGGPLLLSMPYKDFSIQWGGQVCYEGLYPELSRKLTELGAHILVNTTNDSWFGTSFEPQQHLYMTLARAIETRRPLVRSTNTGISTVITAEGTVLQQSPINEKWVGYYKIPFTKNPEQTIFVRWGYLFWIPVLFTLSLFILFGYGFLKRREFYEKS